MKSELRFGTIFLLDLFLAMLIPSSWLYSEEESLSLPESDPDSPSESLPDEDEESESLLLSLLLSLAFPSLLL